ncbi:dTDP-4-dehydrorhamnose reductase [Georgenia sp. AZ-5]|uniref:dTDP-4-dehydrorhamnose reductase n=1 Tax=Georgenia sp. AZ-5 TaxID=3367526 RepID=UPI0037544B4C
MRWLVTGAGGMLGTDVVSLLTAAGEEVVPHTRQQLDITTPAVVESAIDDVDVVINCAAWTAVDDAETHESEAFRINAVGPQLLARAAKRVGARMVQISTDYVFDGHASTPYGEGAAMAPASAYGRTKAAGEWAVRAETDDFLILRTAWLYGAHGGCFPKTMARLAAERPELQVVGDQVGQPTWTADVADLLRRLVDAGAPSGVYHATATGYVSWHGFTKEIVSSIGRSPEMVKETTSEAFVRPAPRPAFSVLGHDALERAGVAPIGDWAERWHAAAPDVVGLA